MADPEQRSRRVVRASAAFGVAAALSNVGQLAYTAITARAIGPAAFAPYAAALIALTLGTVAASAGLSSAILRAPEWSRARERGLLTVVAALGFGVLLLLVALGTVWDRVSGVAGSGDVLRLSAPLAVLTPVGLAGLTLVRRSARGTRAAGIEAAGQLGGFAAGAVAVTLSRTTASLLVAVYVSAAVTLVLSWASLRRWPLPGRPSQARDESTFIARMIPLSFASFAILQVPTLWAGRNLGVDQYARYYRGWLVDGIVSGQMWGALTKAVAPEYRTVAPERRGTSIAELVLVSWAIASLAFAVLAGAADPVVAVLLGPAWAGTGTWIAAMALAAALAVPAVLLGNFAEFTASYRALYLGQACAFVLMVASILMVGHTPWAPWTPAVAQTVLFGAMAVSTSALLRGHVAWRPVRRGLLLHSLLAFAAFALVLGLVTLGGRSQGVVGEIIGAVIAALAIAGVLLWRGRRLPAGRLLDARGLLPEWLP